MKVDVNEPALLKRIAGNDQSAYQELFERYYDRLHRLALLLTRSRELSEEIVSDVFIALWRRRQHAESIQNLRLYLYVSTRNTAFNYLDKLKKTSTVSLDNLDPEVREPFANPEEAFVTKEMNQRIRRAIEQLPPRCRMVFRLVKEDGLSYKEAADLLNLSVGTIDNQLVLAIKKLSRSLFYRFSATQKKS